LTIDRGQLEDKRELRIENEKLRMKFFDVLEMALV